MSLSKPPKPAYLKDPKRILNITDGRGLHKQIANDQVIAENLKLGEDAEYLPHALLNLLVSQTQGEPTEMYLKDIKIGPVEIYWNQFIEFTVIGDPYQTGKETTVTVEDKQKDVGQLFLYIFPQNEFYLEALEYGSVIRVKNPYGLIGHHPQGKRPVFSNAPICYVFDANAITVLGKKTDMCRYLSWRGECHKEVFAV